MATISKIAGWVFALLALLAQVHPQIAIINLQAWFEKLGFQDAPSWLSLLDDRQSVTLLVMAAIFFGLALLATRREAPSPVLDALGVDSDPGLEPDIKAVEGFNTILARSEWARMNAANPDALPEAWYERGRSPNDVIEDRLVQALDREIHDSLARGSLHAWGRTGEAGVEVLIPTQDWRDIKIGFDERALKSRSSDGEAANTSAWKQGRNVRERRLAYVNVRFSAKELYDRYPLSREARKPRGEAVPDVSHWRSLERYTLLEAASLWAGILEPPSDLDHALRIPNVRARYRMLTEAIEDGEITAHHPFDPSAPRTIIVPGEGQHSPEMFVGRSALRDLARKKGERPDFLFVTIHTGERWEPLTLAKRRALRDKLVHLKNLKGTLLYDNNQVSRDFAESLAELFQTIGWEVEISPAFWSAEADVEIYARCDLASTMLSAFEDAFDDSLGIRSSGAGSGMDGDDFRIHIADRPARAAQNV